MAEHTKGPWHYQEGGDDYTHIIRAGKNFFVTQLSQDTSGVSEANARLMAKAPEMLTELKLLLEAISLIEKVEIPLSIALKLVDKIDRTRMRELIAKAEGK